MVRGVSLHIGINEVDASHYAGWSGTLEACERDADAMHAIATQQGFESSLLKTKSATRAAVIEHIKRLAGEHGLRDGDIFLLTYAGHGGQVTDVDGDEDDLKDETWCLFDGHLLDDELNLLWADFSPGVRILLFSDSCHSGSVSKGEGFGASSEDALSAESEPVRYRFMPRDAAVRTFRENRDFYTDLQLQIPDPRPRIHATVRLISGCQDDQLSAEVFGSGRFTRALKRLWSDGAFVGCYADFHREICALLPSTQQPVHTVLGPPNPSYDEQRPFTI